MNVFGPVGGNAALHGASPDDHSLVDVEGASLGSHPASHGHVHIGHAIRPENRTLSPPTPISSNTGGIENISQALPTMLMPVPCLAARNDQVLSMPAQQGQREADEAHPTAPCAWHLVLDRLLLGRGPEAETLPGLW